MVRLPVEYQEVEYLESNGSQNLNLPYGFLDTDEVELVCEVRTTINDRFMISTSTWNDNYNRFCMAGNYGGDFRVGFGDLPTGRSSSYYFNPAIPLDALKHTWLYKNRLFTMLDGDTQIASCDVSSVNFGGETSYLKLFYGYNKNTAGRIYSFKQIKQSGESLNLIPCYRKSDSEPGMYDTVSGTFFTNAGTGTFIVGNDVSWDTASLIERRRQILLNTPHLTTESANPLTFQTDISANLKDCKIYFEPVQKGSGDPSPDNVRPISGWDGVTVTRCGKCIYDGLSIATLASGGVARTIYEDDHGRYVSIDNVNTYYPFPDGMIKENTRYTFILSTYASAKVAYLRIQYSDGTTEIITVNSEINTAAFTTKAGKTLQGINCIMRSVTRKLYIDESGLFEGVLTTNDYEPYSGTSITIPFPQTIYGGYVDLVKGEVVETDYLLTVDENTVPYNVRRNTGGRVVGYYNLPYAGIKDAFTYYSHGQCIKSTTATYNYQVAGCVANEPYNSDAVRAAISASSDITTVEQYPDWIANVAPLQIAYKLATHNTYPLTPQTIKTLKGINNIWSNANGNIELRFWKH